MGLRRGISKAHRDKGEIVAVLSADAGDVLSGLALAPAHY